MSDYTMKVYGLALFQTALWEGAVEEWDDATATWEAYLLDRSYAFNATKQRGDVLWTDISAFIAQDTVLVADVDPETMTTLTRTLTGDDWIYDADNLVFSGTFEAGYLAIVNKPNPADNTTWRVMLICDFQRDIPIANGTLTLTWHADGIYEDALTPFA